MPPPAPIPNPLLSWDSVADRKTWSDELLAAVDTYLPELEKGKPNDYIAGYNGLSKAKKRIFWAELIISMAKYESNWDPHGIYHEPPPLSVDSIGLLQLSYEDETSYKFSVVLNREQKNLEDPLINLRCGVFILARWLAKDGTIAAGSTGRDARGGARYWSVLRQGAKHKYPQIRERVKTAVGL